MSDNYNFWDWLYFEKNMDSNEYNRLTEKRKQQLINEYFGDDEE